MKNIKTYEGFWGDVSRLNPKRKESDDKALKLFQDIINDFEVNGSDLRKVKIIDDGGSKISFSEVSIGKYYTLSYVFGKYHPVKRDIHSGNKEHGDRRIKIINFPFSVTFKKNELEKTFNTSRVKLGQARVKDTKTYANLDGTKPHMFDEKKEEYYISSDIANQLFEYFIEEFNSQYPDLKTSRYKGSMEIRDLEQGVKPATKFIRVKGKDGELLTHELRLGENEKEIRKMISNMTKSEYDSFWRKRRDELYEPSRKKDQAFEKEISGKISNILKKNDINLEPDKWNEFGFSRTTVNQYEIVIEFRSTDPEIESKVNNAVKEMQNVDGFEFKNKRIQSGYSDKTTKYILLHFEK